MNYDSYEQHEFVHMNPVEGNLADSTHFSQLGHEATRVNLR